MIKQLRAAGPTVVVDAGSSLAKRPVQGDASMQLSQRRAKASAVVQSLMLSGIDAMTLSSVDWSLGGAWVRQLLVQHQAPVLAANLSCDGVAPFAGHKVLSRGARRVAVVGVTDGPVEGCAVTDAQEALRRVVESLEDVDLVIALVPEDTRQSRRRVASVAGIDLVVDTQPGRQGKAEDLETAWLLGSGPRGQRVGVVDVIWRADADGFAPLGHEASLQAAIGQASRRVASLEARQSKAGGRGDEGLDNLLERARANQAAREAALQAWTVRLEASHHLALQVVELDDSVPDDPGTSALVSSTLAAMTAGEVGEAALVSAQRVVSEGPYIGADVCQGCHPATSAHWLSTPHANAWQTLVEDGHAADFSCFGCHATGVGTPGGPTKPADVGGLRDVQCEACHGPARAHVAAPSEHKPIKKPDVETCRACHDGEQDMGRFVEAVYWPKVVHREEDK